MASFIFEINNLYANESCYFFHHIIAILFKCLDPVRRRSLRHRTVPSRWKDYWDMTIPTEYYEEEFLYFEKDQLNRLAGKEVPDLILRKYATYEKKLKTGRFQQFPEQQLDLNVISQDANRTVPQDAKVSGHKEVS